ncbi:putative Ig domain-containing protein, partial [candidate division CSSED10-310 bacterium]
TMLGGDGVAFSNDLGQTWQSAAGNGLTDREVYDLAIETGTAQRIWSTTASGVFFTANEGLSWTELSSGLPSSIPITSVSIDPNTSEVLVSLFSEEGGGVYRGGNLNGVWREYNNGLKELKVKRLTNDNGHEVDATTWGTTFYAATRGDGVYASELRVQMIDPPGITTHHLPQGLVRAAYDATLTAAEGTSPYYWSLHEGSLPPGMALNGETGQISGEPSQTGVYPFTIQVSDANQQIDRLELTITVVSDQELHVIFCSPEVGIRGQTLDVTISGSTFQDGANSDFGVEVTVNSTTFVSDQELTANVTVAVGAAPGWRTVTVQNPDLSQDSLVDCFKVDYPTPVVSGVDPTQGSRKQTFDVAVSGDFFEEGAAVDFGTGITINAVTFVTTNELTVNITIQTDAPLGLHSVTVTNPNDLSAALADSFEVLAALPTVSSCDPTLGNQGNMMSVTINGDDFQDGATSDFGAGITVNDTTFLTVNQLSASINIAAGAVLGFRTVIVTNPDTQTGNLAEAFKVMGPAPQVTSVDPVGAERGSTLDVTIYGTAFQAGINSDFGAGITVNYTTFTGSTQVSANITIDGQAALGYRNVSVTNADGQGAVKADAFLVAAPAPLVSGCVPDQGNQDTTLDVTINGSLFLDGATSTFGAGITVNSTTYQSSTELTANISIDAGATPGFRDVTVTNPDSKQDTLDSGFEVLAQAPLVLTANPNLGYQTTSMDVIIKGNYFQAGAVADFGPDITVQATLFDSVTTLTAQIYLDANAEKGLRTITITNPDAQSGTLEEGYTIEAPPYSYYQYPYDWIDVSGGISAGVNGDDAAAVIPIGFSFNFFGRNYTEVIVSSNGYLTFGDAGLAFYNTCLPEAGTPNAMIGVFWDDFTSADQITYQVLGEAPDRQCVIQWTDVPRVGIPGTATFQAIIKEQLHTIILQYQDVILDHPSYDYGLDGTVGIEDEDGIEGLEIGYNEPVLQNETAYLISNLEGPEAVPAVRPGGLVILITLFSMIIGITGYTWTRQQAKREGKKIVRD